MIYNEYIINNMCLILVASRSVYDIIYDRIVNIWLGKPTKSPGEVLIEEGAVELWAEKRGVASRTGGVEVLGLSNINEYVSGSCKCTSMRKLVQEP